MTAALAVAEVQRTLDERDRLLAIAAKVVHLGGWTVSLADGMEHFSDGCAPCTSCRQACNAHRAAGAGVLRAGVATGDHGRLQRVCRAGYPYDLELEIITAAGRRVAVREIGEAVRGPDGSIDRVHGAFQDLSALREAEAKAEQIGARLVPRFEHVTDAFYTLDRDWRYTYLNPEAVRMQGKSRSAMLGKVVWDVFPEAVGSEFDVQFRRAVETGDVASFESYYEPLDMSFEVRAFPSEDGLAVYFLDVSQKRAAERALAASEQRYRALFERAGDAI